MVTLKNIGGGVRVVYDINRKAHAIPPTGEVELMLSDSCIKRFNRAMEKGDTLLVLGVNYDPAEELKNSEAVVNPAPAPDPMPMAFPVDTGSRNGATPPPEPRRGRRNRRERRQPLQG